jgi:hypothetical protein
LSENGVNNIRLRTANKKILQRDLDHFKSSADVPVLLLPIRYLSPLAAHTPQQQSLEDTVNSSLLRALQGLAATDST